MPTLQEVSLHADKIYDIAGGALDEVGNPITLTNLDFTPDTSPVGTDVGDSDETDNNDGLDTAGMAVGAVETLTFNADGSDGLKYQATAQVTIVAEDVEPSDFNLTFTVRP